MLHLYCWSLQDADTQTNFKCGRIDWSEQLITCLEASELVPPKPRIALTESCEHLHPLKGASYD